MVARVVGEVAGGGSIHAGDLEHRQGDWTHLGVMRDKEGEAACGSDEVLQGGMRDGKAVVRRGAPSQLVYDHQRARRRPRQDAAGLRQLLQTCIQDSSPVGHVRKDVHNSSLAFDC